MTVEKCPNCGAQLEENARFCAECGSRIDFNSTRKALDTCLDQNKTEGLRLNSDTSGLSNPFSLHSDKDIDKILNPVLSPLPQQKKIIFREWNPRPDESFDNASEYITPEQTPIKNITEVTIPTQEETVPCPTEKVPVKRPDEKESITGEEISEEEVLAEVIPVSEELLEKKPAAEELTEEEPAAEEESEAEEIHPVETTEEEAPVEELSPMPPVEEEPLMEEIPEEEPEAEEEPLMEELPEEKPVAEEEPVAEEIHPVETTEEEAPAEESLAADLPPMTLVEDEPLMEELPEEEPAEEEEPLMEEIPVDEPMAQEIPAEKSKMDELPEIEHPLENISKSDLADVEMSSVEPVPDLSKISQHLTNRADLYAQQEFPEMKNGRFLTEADILTQKYADMKEESQLLVKEALKADHTEPKHQETALQPNRVITRSVGGGFKAKAAAEKRNNNMGRFGRKK